MTWNSLIVESAAPWRFWFSDESSLLTPLIWNVAPRVPVPLKLIDEPDDSRRVVLPAGRVVLEPGKDLGEREEAAGAERRLVADLLGGQRALDLGVGRVDRRRGADDRDGLGDRGRLHLKVGDPGLVQPEVDVFAHDGREAVELDGDAVAADRQERRAVEADAVGRQVARGACFEIPDRHRRRRAARRRWHQ